MSFFFGRWEQADMRMLFDSRRHNDSIIVCVRGVFGRMTKGVRSSKYAVAAEKMPTLRAIVCNMYERIPKVVVCSVCSTTTFHRHCLISVNQITTTTAQTIGHPTMNRQFRIICFRVASGVRSILFLILKVLLCLACRLSLKFQESARWWILDSVEHFLSSFECESTSISIKCVFHWNCKQTTCNSTNYDWMNNHRKCWLVENMIQNMDAITICFSTLFFCNVNHERLINMNTSQHTAKKTNKKNAIYSPLFVLLHSLRSFFLH